MFIIVILLFVLVVLSSVHSSTAFSVIPSTTRQFQTNEQLTLMHMATRKKKRRKRKKLPVPPKGGEPPQDSNKPMMSSLVEPPPATSSTTSINEINMAQKQSKATDIEQQLSAAAFNPSQDAAIDSTKDDPSRYEAPGVLPDIRDALKRKKERQIESEQEEKRKESRPKISRRDVKAFEELLEAEPNADMDDSFFEKEEYGTVSALLGEGSSDFIGIPPGPLQLGHFIGALGIIICAFVEYPGFPLTNLPTPLRSSLQGTLGTVYIINAVLAVLAFLKAPEKGTSSVLWAVKTFTVGGLAYDQLTQLPKKK